jgi:hypothetical protein
MSIAHATIVSPLATQHAPYRRCDPARRYCLVSVEQVDTF